MHAISGISESIKSTRDNIIQFSVKQKSPILATVSAASFMASNFMPPPARSVCLAASALAGALSIGSLASDLTNKMTETLDGNLKEVNKTGANVVNAMGENVLTPIELKPVTAEEKAKMSVTKPIMDNTTKTAWDRITQWVSLTDKPKFNKRQSNYDCLYMYGPPGTGKTVFAKALFGAVNDNYDFKLANITAGDLMERGAEKLNHLKKEVLGLIDNAKDANKPVCIGFFLDEVEGSLNKDRSLNAGVVNEYLTFINEIKDAAAHNPNVYILGALATNYDEQVDRASKRDGRVTETLHINYPNASSKPDDNTADTSSSDTPKNNNTVSKVIQDILLGDKTNNTKGTIDKLDSRYEHHLQKIKNLITTQINDQSNPPIKQALSEENLTGASVENAVIKTQKDIALMTQPPKNIPDEFIKRLSVNIIQAAKIATQQRTKDDEELKARQSLSTQLSGMREALEKMAGKDDVDNMKSIHENLKEIDKQQRTKDEEELKARQALSQQLSGMREALEKMAEKTGDNKLFEPIVKAMETIQKNVIDTNKNTTQQFESLAKTIDATSKAFKSLQQNMGNVIGQHDTRWVEDLQNLRDRIDDMLHTIADNLTINFTPKSCSSEEENKNSE